MDKITIDLYSIFEHVSYIPLLGSMASNLFSIFHWKTKYNSKELKELVQLFKQYGLYELGFEDEFTDIVLRVELDGERPKIIRYKKEGQQPFYKFFRKYRHKLYANNLKENNNDYYWSSNT